MKKAVQHTVLDGFGNESGGAGVYFCTPLDLDYSMLTAFPAAYQVVEPGQLGPSLRGEPRTAVLGEEGRPAFYDGGHDAAMRWYRYLFLGRGKPSTHVRVLSSMDLAALRAGMPQELRALLTTVIQRLGAQVAAGA